MSFLQGRSAGSALRAWVDSRLWREGERSPFWWRVVRAIRARRALWRVYFTARRGLRVRAGERMAAPELRPPLGRSAADAEFARSRKPLIRWVKGDGRDDEITRSAIAQATRLFGDAVDYCLAINGIDAARAAKIVEWAARPVHIWLQQPDDNPPLAQLLDLAGCPPERFGYWWKWFPARMRPQAPEWILDGDQVIVRKPAWFDAWLSGTDVVRVAEDDVSDPRRIYGQYAGDVRPGNRVYSGILSLPPNVDYLAPMLDLLSKKPLVPPHDGRNDSSEQGCFAAAFNEMKIETIPLSEFPFARAWEPELDFGKAGRGAEPWGYHFGGSFRVANPHFKRMVEMGEVFSVRTDQKL
jgi:hypothetical protein